MGSLFFKLVHQLDLPDHKIQIINKKSVIYIPDRILNFDEDIERECYEILSKVKQNNLIAQIYYDGMTIYGIGIKDYSYFCISHKFSPTSFGYTL